jgi:hypothetical protein
MLIGKKIALDIIITHRFKSKDNPDHSSGLGDIPTEI